MSENFFDQFDTSSQATGNPFDVFDAPDDKFEGEGVAALASRRGQQFAKGATEAVASIPEAAALAGAGNENAAALFASETIAREQEQIALAEQRLLEQPSMDEETRSRIQAVIDQSQNTISKYKPLVDIAVGPLKPAASERALFKKGDEIRDASADLVGAPDPEDTSFWAKVAEGGGNLTGMVGVAALTGPLAPLTGAGLGSSMNSTQLYKEALQSGADEETAKKAASYGALIGASEIVPITRALKLLPPQVRSNISNKFMKKFVSIGQSAGEEAAQEYLATVANNIVAQKLFDSERGWNEGAAEAALVGAVLGGGLGAVGNAVNSDRLDSPRLTEADRASPIANAVIDDGKAIIDNLLDGTEMPASIESVDAPREAPQAPSQPLVQTEPTIAPEPPKAIADVALSVPEFASPDVIDPVGQLPSVEPVGTPQQPIALDVPDESVSDRFEVLPEEDGQGNETGRLVRIDKQTGKASIVSEPDLAQPDAIEEVQIEPVPVEAAPVVVEEAPVEDNGESVVTLTNEDLSKIETDAVAFQYKAGGDQDGVTDALRGVTTWDPDRAGVAMVYEKTDGARTIVDGHQRLGFAKRAIADGQEVSLPVRILRERDGVTPEHARVRAALKNIAEGSGTAIDAAKILRDTGKTAKEWDLAMSKSVARDGDGLSQLSDVAFGMITNEVAPINYGAAVGSLAPDASSHASILGLLTKLKPRNAVEVQSIVRQASETVTTETQDSLFGSEDLSTNLYIEKARVLDRVLKDLGQNVQTFRTLTKRGESISAVGNKLDQDANAAQLTDDEKAKVEIAASAHMKGPISDALTEAARAYKGGTKIGSAATKFIQAVRRGPVEDTATSYGGRRTGDSAEQAERSSEEVNSNSQVIEERELPKQSVTDSAAETSYDRSVVDLFGEATPDDALGQDADNGVTDASEKSQEQPTLTYGSAALDSDVSAEFFPALRKNLDRMMLKNVRLGSDANETRQGAFVSDGLGEMDILIGQSIDPEATVYHESVHALNEMGLFTATEWAALEAEANKTWVSEHDIESRYPNLDRNMQIEEAIAEAFGAWATNKSKPVGLIGTAFAKMKRFMRAVRNAANGLGFQTSDDIFGKAISGEIGSRNAGSTVVTAKTHEQAPPRRDTGDMQGGIHIPDRRIWEELTDNSNQMFDRLSGAKGAASDWIDKGRITLQDRMLPILRSQEAIAIATGRPIDEAQNAYLAEETFSGKVGKHLFDIDEQYTKPIIDIIGETKGGLTTDSVGEWLMARHAKERNDHIASINEAKPDGGSGMTTMEAETVLNKAAKGPHQADLVKIGDLILGLRDRDLELRVDAGLMTAADAEIWRNQYEHYVPLKGWEETDHADAALQTGGAGRRFNTRGQESKRALGRASRAFNPLQAALTQAQEVSIRAEKNRVAATMYNLVSQNDAPAMWEVKTPQSKRYFNKASGLVETRVEQPAGMMMAPNEMAVKVGGVERRIMFNDPRLAKSLGAVGADQMNMFVRVMSHFSRYISTVNTMLSPEFVVTNAFRDITAARLNIEAFGNEDRTRIGRAMIRDWRKALVGAYGGMKGKADTEWQKHYAEFEAAGGKVSFWVMDQPEAAKSEMDSRIKLKHGTKLQKASRLLSFSLRDNPVLAILEQSNMAVDNAVRLAAFVEARKAGWSAQQAASLSKNLTVNFNRRGEGGATLNALYTFANASIQGNMTILRALKSRKVLAAAGGLFSSAVVLDQINAAMSGEDEDGELAYDKIQDHKNRRSIVIMAGNGSESAITIPMPYGWSLFSYGGQQVGKIMRGVKEPSEVMGDMAVATFDTFSPIGGGGLLEMLTPTALDPISEMVRNKNWLDRSIRPEDPYGDYGPDAYKFYANASVASQSVSDKLNRLTGGNRTESGWIDVSPEYLDHAFAFAAGGAGRFFGEVVDTTTKLAAGRSDEVRSSSIPFYGQLAYETGDWLDVSRFYQFRDTVLSAKTAVETQRSTGDSVSEATRTLAKLAPKLKIADSGMKTYRKSRDRLLANESLSVDEMREGREKLSERQARIVLSFNRAYIKAMGWQGE